MKHASHERTKMARRKIDEIAVSPFAPPSPAVESRRHLCFAEFTVDLPRLSLLRDGEPIYLRRQSFDRSDGRSRAGRAGRAHVPRALCQER